MSRPKKLKPKDKVVLTKSDITRMFHSATYRAFIMFTCWAMDEWDFDKDKIIQAWDDINRWSEAIDKEKTLKLQTVCDIINEHTGLDLKW